MIDVTSLSLWDKVLFKNTLHNILLQNIEKKTNHMNVFEVIIVIYSLFLIGLSLPL